MADPNAATVQSFVAVLLESANASLKRAIDGLTDEQVFHQPSQDTNNIAWLAWHLYRWQDRQGGVLSGEEQVWTRDGWCERFGLAADSTGLGDTPEQVAAFRPPLDLLWAYTEAALARRSSIGSTHSRRSSLRREVRYLPHLEPRPRWRVILAVCSDTMKHTGQIEYLRGFLTGKGWFPA